MGCLEFTPCPPRHRGTRTLTAALPAHTSASFPSSWPWISKCVCVHHLDPRPPSGVPIHSLSGMSLRHGTLSSAPWQRSPCPVSLVTTTPESLGWFSHGCVGGVAEGVTSRLPATVRLLLSCLRAGRRQCQRGGGPSSCRHPPSRLRRLETSALLSTVLRAAAARQSRRAGPLCCGSGKAGWRNSHPSFGADTGKGHAATS